MTLLAIAAIVFVAIHVLPSTPLRAVATGAIGEMGWTITFSLVSFVAIGWMVSTYNGTEAGAPFYLPGAAVRHAAVVVAFAGVWLALTGLFTPGDPSQAGPGRGKPGERSARGARRITRHPFLFGAGLWALAHMAANPTARDWWLFGSLAVLSFGGALAQDRRHARNYGAPYVDYLQRTSYLPFAAILGGRNRLALAELGWRALLALLVCIGILHGHVYLFGVAPLG